MWKVSPPRVALLAGAASLHVSRPLIYSVISVGQTLCSINVYGNIFLSALDGSLFLFSHSASFTLFLLFAFPPFLFFSPRLVFFMDMFSFLFLPCVVFSMRPLVATVTCWTTLSFCPFFLSWFLFSLFRNLLWFWGLSCSFSVLFDVRTWDTWIILVSSFSPFPVVHVSPSFSMIETIAL